VETKTSRMKWLVPHKILLGILIFLVSINFRSRTSGIIFHIFPLVGHCSKNKLVIIQKCEVFIILDTKILGVASMVVW